MKDSLTLISLFFIILLLALIFCPFFYSLSQPDAFCALAEGEYAFFLEKALENTFDFIPTAAVLAFSSIFVFVARHRVQKMAAFFVFLALLLLTFLAIEPAAVRSKLNLQRGRTESDGVSISSPQAGAIREASPSVKAILLEGGDAQASPVLVAAETSAGDGRGLNVYSGGDATRLAAGLSSLDLGIEKKLKPPALLKKLSQDIDDTHSIIFEAAATSASAYLWTGGAFFALAASLFFLCVLTDWKLINFTLYAFALRALYGLFPLLHGERCVSFLSRLLPRFFSEAAVSALPALLIAALIAAAGFALILPQYEKRNQGGEIL